VGKDTFKKSLGCLKVRGYMVSFGQSSGSIPPINIDDLKTKSIYLIRPALPHFIRDHAELQSRADQLFNWVIAGKLKAFIDSTYPLSAASQAHQRIESRLSIGKCILIP
jgi:NADPH2:quinone reductase